MEYQQEEVEEVQQVREVEDLRISSRLLIQQQWLGICVGNWVKAGYLEMSAPSDKWLGADDHDG